MTKHMDLNKKVILPLSVGDLQFFNDGGAPEDPPAPKDDGGNNPPADPKPADQGTPKDPPADPVKKDPEPSTQKGDEKTFNQEDVSNIAAREAKKAQEKLLKQLGVKDFESAKEGLTQFKAMQDEQKTEAEKLQESYDALSGEKAQYETKVSNLEAQVSVMKAGVKADSVNDVVVLANNLVTEDVDLSTAITQVIEKYPQFKEVVQAEDPEEGANKGKPNFAQGTYKGKPQDSTADKWKNAFSFGK